jgi:hypothetical protein
MEDKRMKSEKKPKSLAVNAVVQSGEKKRKNRKLKAGRRKKKFSVIEFTRLCQLPLGLHDLARAMGFSLDTLQRRMKENPELREIWKQGKSVFRGNILALQMKAARRLNPAILVHLGKNYCGQSDKAQDTPSARIVEIRLPQTIDLSQMLGLGEVKKPQIESKSDTEDAVIVKKPSDSGDSERGKGGGD